MKKGGCCTKNSFYPMAGIHALHLIGIYIVEEMLDLCNHIKLHVNNNDQYRMR